MWRLYGTDSANIEGNTNPKVITALNFKPSANISVADFNNVSNQWIVFDTSANNPENLMSSYIQIGAPGSDLLQYNRFNILHPEAENGNTVYKYDGCYYTWTFETPGTNLYYLKGYRFQSLFYDVIPTLGYAQLTKNNVLSCHLVATPSSETSTGIAVMRTLWGADMTGITGYAKTPIQYWLGPALPESLVEEWFKYVEPTDEENPDKPDLDPESADQAPAHTTGYTWLNQFKIINWSGPWPERFLIDGGLYTDPTLYNQYFAWDDSNDAEERYHGIFDSYDWPSFNAARDQIGRNINNEQVNLGSSVDHIYDMNNDTGYFYTGYGIDNFSGGSVEHIYPVLSQNNYTLNIEDLDITYPNNSFMYSSLNYITYSIDNKTFSIDTSYSNNTNTFSTYRNDVTNSFYSFNIIRYNSHYYLGGLFRAGTGTYKRLGFCILCQIDNLDKLPNYGGSNPEDPTDSGIPTSDIDNIFGTGSGLKPNPTTGSLINDGIGDAPTSDGSAFNPDGTPKNPLDYNTGGTGEKNSNPVDSEQIVNTHDGSLGNGTGDIHSGDTEISDPADSLPSGTDTEGTVSGSGVLSVFTPTLAELTSFTSELLSNTVLDSIKNYFTTNPMDGIFGLHIIPYSGFSGAATANPRIGTHTFTSALTLASSEYITINYGEITIPFVYDGYENYAPHSDAKIFLPFIGMKDIDINIIQGCKITLKYNVSLVTGDIYAYLYAKWASSWGKADTGQGVDHLVYHWQGNCAATVPLSHLDSTNYISGAMQIAGGITSLVAGAAAANPYSIPGGVAGVANGVAEIGRTSIISSGNISGMSAFMGCREPYIILSRPIIAFNKSYNHYLGQRSNAIQSIGDLRFNTFTIMRNVDLTGIPATSDELNEIEGILKGGFYI